MTEQRFIPPGNTGDRPSDEDPPYDFINFIGGSEQKLLLTATLACMPDPEEFYKESQLKIGVRNRQRAPEVWRPASGVIAGYVNYSLLPAKVAEKDSVMGSRGVPAVAFRSTTLGRTRALAFAGALLSWSLDYPEPSVQRILGSTRKKRAHKLDSSETYKEIPRSRFALYSELTTQEGPVYISDFREKFGLGHDECRDLLADLRIAGILLRRPRNNRGKLELATPLLERAVGALVHSVLDSQVDEKQEYYQSLARELIGDKRCFTELARKALRFSSYARLNTYETSGTVESAIYKTLSRGPATAADIFGSMRNRRTPHSPELVRVYLRAMLKEGEIRVKIDPSDKRRRIYSLTPFDEL